MTKRRKTFLGKLGEKILLSVLPFFTYGLLQFLRLTVRIEEINTEALRALTKDSGEEPSSIIAFWHSRLLMMPLLRRKRRVTILISRHRDGELIHRAIRFFPIDTVRGSTTRGGARALRGLVRALRSGSHVAITPDGPRGPRNLVQAGAIILASMTGRPIVPVTFSASRKKVFQSWDRFLLPYPFSHGVFVWGEPIWVDPEDSQAGIEEKRKTLELRLNRITAQADRYFDQ